MRSPKRTSALSLLLIATAIGAVFAAAPSAHAQRRAPLRVRIGARPAPMPAAPTMAELESAAWLPQLQQWCDETAQILLEGRASASVLVARQRYAEAIASLTATLQYAGEGISFGGGAQQPITAKLIDRGLRSARDIRAVVGSDQASQLALAHFLYEYVGFVAGAAVQLDREFYLPYHYGCSGQWGRCPGMDFERFERQFAEFGRGQLHFVADELTLSRGGFIYPAGNPLVFLKAAELFSAFVAQDLSMLLEAYSQACSISRLRRFSQRVRMVIHGDPRMPVPYPSLPHAVHSLASELRVLADSLTESTCFRRWPSMPDDVYYP